jgi:hypothetical protein
VGEGRGVGQVVDGNYFDVGTLNEVAKGQAADASKTVYGYSFHNGCKNRI